MITNQVRLLAEDILMRANGNGQAIQQRVENALALAAAFYVEIDKRNAQEQPPAKAGATKTKAKAA